MIHYVIVNSRGEIFQAGSKAPEVFNRLLVPAGHSIHRTQGPIDPETHFWKNGIKRRPERPNPWAVFDTDIEQWIDPADLKQAKIESISKVNNEAGRARTVFATDIAFQGELYEEKRKEAQRYLDTSPEPFELSKAEWPFLKQEVGRSAPTARDLCQVWLHMGDFWVQKLAGIEGIRTEAIENIESAKTIDEMEEIVTTSVASFKDITTPNSKS